MSGEVVPAVIIDLDSFARWLANVLGIAEAPDPTADLEHDLGLDDYSMLGVVAAFDSLVKSWSAPAQPEIYYSITTVRDLYLHYLTVVSMPPAMLP
jgi:hypothetical protein